MDTLMTVIISVLSAFFIFAGSIKLLGWQKMIFDKQLEFFHSYGLNRQIMALVGIIELIGATSIWFQSSILGTLGAALLSATSLGAIFFHLRFDTWKDGIPAIVTLILSGVVIFLGYFIN
ncbi:DoxX family protein [Shewanella gelidimarina]|uniref:DoxX family protein n=1 Tax=Shewanella gelidimarina TaxID=56813 RepID=UPI00200E932C|nr:DoxX family protein [Shewanella gelidimarina]MCL1059249.1 DoxX family protein [Shewanella gelidimarina]